MKKLWTLFLCVLSLQLSAQEIDINVGIDAQQTGKMQLSIFRTLQSSVEDFLNTTRWTDRNLDRDQRIKADIFITIRSYDDNRFEGSIQVQSSRPVYGSSMLTPVFNYMDNKFNFSYEEGQPLDFNPNSYDNNLVSTLSYYVYVVLGLDADTFSPGGGSDFFSQADQIASIAQQGGSSGWSAGSGGNSRYDLIRQLYSSNYQLFHEALYTYHRLGLDQMHEDIEEGKGNVVEALNQLNELNRTRPNSAVVRSFFDAKANEVYSIFRDGPAVDDIDALIQHLNNMAPTYSSQWREL